MDKYHHRPRRRWHRVRREHVEREAVLAHRLQLQRRGERQVLLLDERVAEGVTFAHTTPRFRRLRRAESLVAQRWRGERNAPPADRPTATATAPTSPDSVAITRSIDTIGLTVLHPGGSGARLLGEPGIAAGRDHLVGGDHGSLRFQVPARLVGSDRPGERQWQSNCARIPGLSALASSFCTSDHASSPAVGASALRPENVG